MNKISNPKIWLAIDRDTGEIVGVAVGNRSRVTAQQLWNSLPGRSVHLRQRISRLVGKTLSFSKNPLITLVQFGILFTIITLLS